MIATGSEIKSFGFDLRDLSCKCCGIYRVELSILERMRCFFDFTHKLNLKITSCCRCWNHHVQIYKDIYQDNWYEKISKQSKHLISNEHGDELASCAMDITGQLLHLEAVDLTLNDSVQGWHGGYHFYNRGRNGSSIHLDTARIRRW